MRSPVLVVALSLSACAGREGAVDVSRVVDRAAPMPPGTPTGLEFAPLGEPPAVPLRGAVEAIGPYSGAAGYLQITLAGAGDAASRSFLVTGTKAPFAVGEVLELRRHRVPVGALAFDESDELRDGSGTLLAVSFTGGTAPDGWSALQVGSSGSGCRVLFKYAGAEALVPSGEWRRVATSDGSWDVTARCPPPEKSGARSIPDYVPAPLVVEASRVR